MDSSDFRWHNRLSNFEKALAQLNSAVKLSEERELSNLEQQGLIQTFEFTHELAWKVMRDYFLYQGNSQITGIRDATREAFKAGLISNGEVWMDMIKSRNESSHTYDEDTANEIVKKIIGGYISLLNDLKEKLTLIKDRDQKSWG